MHDIRVRSLGWEDPMEKKMVTRSSILAWEIPWTVEPGGLQSVGSQKVRHDLATEHAQRIFTLMPNTQKFLRSPFFN